MVRRITNEILGVKRLILIGWESGANFLEQSPNEVNLRKTKDIPNYF